MEKIAILAVLVLMLSAPTFGRIPVESNTIKMVTNGANNVEPKIMRHATMPMIVKEEIYVIEEPIKVEFEENGALKCANVLEDCFRTPCCSGLRCDLGIHARCV